MSNIYDTAELKAIPIDEVCRAYGIEVKNRGGGLWCAIRDEKTPSCKLYMQNNTFCDFGNANFGGDTITLTKFVFSCDTKQAIEKLAQTFGIQPIRRDNYDVDVALSNWQYAEIGLYGDLASKNFDFDIDKYGIESVRKFAQKYSMTMNELKKEYPKVYENVLKARALPFLRARANDYYVSLHTHDLLCSELNIDFAQKPNELERFADNVKELNQAEKIMQQALQDTQIKRRPKTYNALEDLTAIRTGKLTPDIGNTIYSELKNREALLGRQLQYKEVPVEQYRHANLTDIPHSAFLKKDKVNVCFSEDYKQQIEIKLKGTDCNEQIRTASQGSRANATAGSGYARL